MENRFDGAGVKVTVIVASGETIADEKLRVIVPALGIDVGDAVGIGVAVGVGVGVGVARGVAVGVGVVVVLGVAVGVGVGVDVDP